MSRWMLFMLLFVSTGPVLAQPEGSRAGIPFSPTQQFEYSTATYAPPGGFSQAHSNYYYGGYGAGYYGYGYGYGNGSYVGSDNYRISPSSYGSGTSGYSSGRSHSGTPGRSFPSAREESQLHEIRR